MTGESFIDVDFCRQAKAGQVVAGDVFLSRKIKEEGRVITVLSDGLQSWAAAGQFGDVSGQFQFAHCRGQFERAAKPDVGGDHGEQVVDRVGADGVEHGALFVVGIEKVRHRKRD